MSPAERGELLAAIHARLQASGDTIAVAESLTGGLLSAALTETAGASASMRGGLVVYATDLKAALAGVDPVLLARAGAVHPEVAEQLASGARTRCTSTYGLGITGVAGPSEQDGQPVGTVFVALAGPDGPWGRRLSLTGTRAQVRSAAVEAALEFVYEVLQDRESAASTDR